MAGIAVLARPAALSQRVARAKPAGRSLPAFTVVMLLAFFLRVWQLPTVPSGLLWDEGAEGLEAARLFSGQFPIFFPEHSGHEPLLIYLQAGALKLLGWSVFALRLPAAILGTLGVAAIFLAARRLFGWRVAAAASFLAAINLSQLTISRLGTRPEAVVLFSAVSLYWLARWLESGELSAAVWAGLSVGLGQYSYTAARFLFPCLLLALAGGLLRRPGARIQVIRQAGAAILAALAVSGPLAWYFGTHPGTFTERAQGLSIFDGVYGTPLQAGMHSFAATAGVFAIAGERGWDKNIAGQALFNPVLAALFFAGLLLAVYRIRRFQYWLIVAWLVLMLLPLALTAHDFGDFGRLAGAAPATFIFPALTIDAGLALCAGVRLRAAARSVLVLGAIALVALAYRDYFVVWQGSAQRQQVYRPDVLEAGEQALARLSGPAAPATLYFGATEPFDAVTDFLQAGFHIEHPAAAARLAGFDARDTLVLPPAGAQSYVITDGLPAVTSLPELPTPASWQLGTALTVQAYDLPSHVSPGNAVPFRVRWQPGRPPSSDVTFFAHLLNYSQQQTLADVDANGFPASGWRDGETVLSTFALQIPAGAQPGAYWLEFGAYLAGGQRLPIAGQSRVLLGPVIVAAPGSAGTPKASFGSGVDLATSAVKQQGHGLEVDLSWRASAQPSADYSVFVHVLDASGRLVAQADGPPDGGQWPSRYWQPGADVPDVHHLTLPANLPPGRYSVDAGLYRLDNGQRLPVRASGPEPDSVLIGMVTV